MYSRGKLPQERIDLLESIGFEWRLRPYFVRVPWMEMYQRLVAYKKKHNNTRVPCRYGEDSQLGFWVTQQRRFCKDKDRIELLNDIGFEWNPQRDAWMEMYRRLVTYKRKHGSVCVPRHRGKYSRLGLWVHRQRQRCKESYRIQLLNGIGFHWGTKRK
jgi:hypothetical protein